MTVTANFGWTEPTVGGDADAWGTELNATLVGIDGVVGRCANVLINGDFRINQRAYVSGATLAAGVYGHDRFKAGASGGDYSFTQVASPTAVTIAANKSLVQVVENVNVVGGSYTLSWTGTATARITINSATPSGNFAVSPITVAGQTAGTTMSVEFTGANAAGGSTIATNTGTLGTAKLENNTVPTPFIPDDYAISLQKCERYCRRFLASSSSMVLSVMSAWSTTATWGKILPLPVTMRTTPTVTYSSLSHMSLWHFAADIAYPVTSWTVDASPDGIGAATISASTGSLSGSGVAIVLSAASSSLWINCDAEL